MLMVSWGVPGVLYQGSMPRSRLSWSGFAAHRASQKASQGTACSNTTHESKWNFDQFWKVWLATLPAMWVGQVKEPKLQLGDFPRAADMCT